MEDVPTAVHPAPAATAQVLIGGVARRLSRSLTTPAIVGLTGVAFVGLRLLGLAGSLPIGVLLGLLAVSGTGTSLAHRRWGPGCTRLQLHLRVAVEVTGATVVVYGMGWGPALALGYVVTMADDMRISGSTAWRPAAGWGVVGIAGGQVAIATGLVSSYIPQPEVHGLAVLAALGLVMIVRLLGQKTAALEDERDRLTAVQDTVRRSEERFRSLVQNSPAIITVSDAEGRVRYVSGSVEPIMGYRPEDIVSGRLLDIVHPDDLALAREALDHVLAHPGAERTVECRVRHADGRWIWQQVSARNELDNPAVAGIVGNHRDISESRAYQEQLAREARHDPLTGLANRKGFLEQLDKALARARQTATGVAVLFVDLDRFKLINDTLGHNVGDRVLTITAERLVASVRSADIVARFAGDEFTVLLEGPTDAAAGTLTAERFTQALNRPMRIGSRVVIVTASVGVTFSAGGVESAEDLLRQADLAMYSAKQAGRDRSAVFDEASTPQFVDRVEMEAALRLAVAREELVLHFQPIVTLPNRTVTGFEALVRWDRPGVGLLGPAAFIGVAEDTGLILGIGDWVLRTACRTLAAWRADHPARQFQMNVNVSAAQLRQPGYAADVAGVLAANGLPAGALTLEITESVLLTGEATAAALHQLHDLGVVLALDDFGTGYSSLSYLRRLPVDIIKIDRAFVAELDRQSPDAAIVRAVTDIARGLGMVTIAEGVETEEQAVALTELGCGLAQGYLFGRPEPAVVAATVLDPDTARI